MTLAWKTSRIFGDTFEVLLPDWWQPQSDDLSFFLLHQDHPSPLIPHSLGVVAGWGISNASSSSPSSSLLTSDVLQYVKLPVVPQDECQASYTSRSIRYNITDNMFCAGFFEGGRDTCLGDSGGAFVMEATRRRWAVFGLVSWAGPEDCGSQRVYGVYTRVDKYLDWIQSHVQAAPWWWGRYTASPSKYSHLWTGVPQFINISKPPPSSWSVLPLLQSACSAEPWPEYVQTLEFWLTLVWIWIHCRIFGNLSIYQEVSVILITADVSIVQIQDFISSVYNIIYIKV